MRKEEQKFLDNIYIYIFSFAVKMSKPRLDLGLLSVKRVVQ